MYYGNVNVTSESNGVNTFDFFDDFEGTALDTNKWTGHYLEGSAGASVTVTNSELTLEQVHQSSGTIYQVYGNANFLNKAIRTKCKFPDYTATTDRGRGGWVGFSESAAFENNTVEVAAWEAHSSVPKIYDVMNGGTESSLNTTPDATAYHIYDLLWISSSSCKFSYDNTYEGEVTSNIPTANLPVSIETYTWSDYDVRSIVDWIFAHKCVVTEPTINIGVIRANVNSLFFSFNF